MQKFPNKVWKSNRHLVSIQHMQTNENLLRANAYNSVESREKKTQTEPSCSTNLHSPTTQLSKNTQTLHPDH